MPLVLCKSIKRQTGDRDSCGTLPGLDTWHFHCLLRPQPPGMAMGTWYLHCATGGSVVCVGVATLYHHWLRGQTAAL